MTISDIDSSLVTVGQPCEGGACWVSFAEAPTFPTNAVTKMSTLSDYESAGELSENGFTESKSVSSTNHKGWHGKTILSTVDETTNTYKSEFVEVSRGTAAKLRYGKANVTVDAASGAVTKIEDNSNNDDKVSLVFDELESNGWLRRTVVKRCKVSSIDDVPHQKGSLMVYGMTFTVLEPLDGSAAIAIYRAKPADDAPAGE